MSMTIHQVVNTIFRSCSYVLSQEHCSWVVDCGDVDKLMPFIDGKLNGILLTHAHFDHIYGLNTLTSLFPKVPVYTNQAGLESLTNDKLNFSRYYGEPFIFDNPHLVQLIDDGKYIDLFEETRVKAVFTPGHSNDSITWVVNNVLFTGDSYIPGVKTVTNLPHSDKILASQSEIIIKQLAENRTVYSGHAPEQI